MLWVQCPRPLEPNIYVLVLALMVEGGYKVGPIKPREADFTHRRFEKVR